MQFKACIITLVIYTASIPLLQAQVSVTDSLVAAQLATKLTGSGVTILNPVLTCPGISEGIFTVTGTSNLGLDSGIILSSGRVKTRAPFEGVNGPRVSAFSSGPSWANNGDTAEADLHMLVPGYQLFDVCKLEFDFIPNGNAVAFDYVFGSTEYKGFSCTRYNDVFGFFISGPGFSSPLNIATIPGTNIPVAVNSTTDTTINSHYVDSNCTNMGLGSPFIHSYVDNRLGTTITYWGFTKPFTARANVIPCQTYHLKLAVADCSDQILDSGVFLKAGSFKADTVATGNLWDTSYCYRDVYATILLRARSGYAAQQWNDGDTNLVHTVNSPGIYWVKYTYCQLVVDTFKITAFRAPVPFSIGPDTTICEGDKRMTLSAPAGNYAYLWQDSSTSQTLHILHTGHYSVTIADAHCSTSDSLVIDPRECHCFPIIPNAFTPNGDGVNDRFIPKLSPDCVPAKSFTFRVFDRWGHQVYSAYTADDKGWDGTFHGKQSEVGTYFYELKYRGRSMDEEEFAKGDVTLVR